MSRKHHYLKIKPQYYRDIEKGLRTFEVRFNDRDFHVYDILHLQECISDEYSGRVITAEVIYLFDDLNFCKEGYVILGIKVIDINN